MPITINGSGSLSGLSAGGLPDATVTPPDLTQPLTLGTAKVSTSGTSIDFSPADSTGIPSWAKRVTIVLGAISASGTSDYIVRIGSGSFVATGYAGAVSRIGAAASFGTAFSTGFQITRDMSNPTDLTYGTLCLNLLTANTWVFAGTTNQAVANSTAISNGQLALSGALDRIRITTVNGTDTFDAGSINIMYE